MEAIDQAQFNFSPTVGLAVSVMVGFLVFAVNMLALTKGSASFGAYHSRTLAITFRQKVNRVKIQDLNTGIIRLRRAREAEYWSVREITQVTFFPTSCEDGNPWYLRMRLSRARRACSDWRPRWTSASRRHLRTGTRRVGRPARDRSPTTISDLSGNHFVVGRALLPGSKICGRKAHVRSRTERFRIRRACGHHQYNCRRHPRCCQSVARRPLRMGGVPGHLGQLVDRRRGRRHNLCANPHPLGRQLARAREWRLGAGSGAPAGNFVCGLDNAYDRDTQNTRRGRKAPHQSHRSLLRGSVEVQP